MLSLHRAAPEFRDDVSSRSVLFLQFQYGRNSNGVLLSIEVAHYEPFLLAIFLFFTFSGTRILIALQMGMGIDFFTLTRIGVTAGSVLSIVLKRTMTTKRSYSSTGTVVAVKRD